ncbi:MAG: restriction endonuclease subunit S [Microcystaceae cyanobacterium]
MSEIEQQTTRGIEQVRQLLNNFPENIILTQYFAYFNTIIFFINTARQQIQTTLNTLSSEDVPIEIIQESGEDLSTLQGKILEEKICLQRILNTLGEIL